MSIFNRFIHRFTHAHVEDIPPTAMTDDFVEQFDHYTQLMKLQDNRQLLEVFVGKNKNSFQSMVVGIDFIHRTFSLDEFSPLVFKPESLIGEKVVIRHQRDWQMLEMHASITDWSPDDHCYYLELPSTAEYQPRRHHNRLTLARNTILNSHINPLYGSPWYATVKDISLGGMRINIPGDLRPHLHKNKVLPKCQIMLDKNISVSCSGQIKAFTYIGKPYKHTQISVEFEGMSRKHQSDLDSFIRYVDEVAA